MSVDAVSGGPNPAMVAQLTRLAVATKTLKAAQNSSLPALELIQKATQSLAGTGGRVDTYA